MSFMHTAASVFGCQQVASWAQSTRFKSAMLCATRLALLMVVLLFVMIGDASACPTCKQALAANGGRWAEGFFWSILFMLGMPASLAFAWGWYLYRCLGKVPNALTPASEQLGVVAE